MRGEIDKTVHDKKRRIMFNILVSCLIAVFACVNRKMPFGVLKMQLIDVFRVTDLLAMLLFVPLTLICLCELLRIYDGLKSKWIFTVFCLGAFFMGCGFGMHDPFNVFVMRYGHEIPDKIYKSILFLDDGLGHWLFFAGFMLVSLSVCFAELSNPAESDFSTGFVVTFSAAAAFVAVGIFRNMVHEKTALDIVVLLACSASALIFQFLKKKEKNFLRLPCNLAMHIAYSGGALLTIAYWIFHK